MSCNMVKSGLIWSRIFRRRHLGRRVTAVTHLRWPTVILIQLIKDLQRYGLEKWPVFLGDAIILLYWILIWLDLSICWLPLHINAFNRVTLRHRICLRRLCIPIAAIACEKIKNNKKVIFPKSWPTYRRQVVYPRHQTLQGQSVAKPGTPL